MLQIVPDIFLHYFWNGGPKVNYILHCQRKKEEFYETSVHWSWENGIIFQNPTITIKYLKYSHWAKDVN